MKEYLYRKIIKYQCRPVMLMIDLIAAFYIMFSGPAILAVPFIAVFWKVVIIPRFQVKYLVPRSMEDMKNQIRINVIMTCLEIAICMLMWFIPTLLIYDKLAVMIRANALFAILWMTVMILYVFRAGIGSECDITSGVEEIEKSSPKKDVLNHFSELLAMGIVNAYLGSNFCFNWLGLSNSIYKSPFTLGILVFTIILLIVEIYRYVHNWEIGEYSD